MKSIAEQLLHEIHRMDLSPSYGAAFPVARRLKIPPKTASGRLMSLTNVRKPHGAIKRLEDVCAALGLEIIIRPIQSPESPKEPNGKHLDQIAPKK
jgi:hypothetical protein